MRLFHLVLVALGNNLAATESEILELGTQVAGKFGSLSKVLKVSGDELLAISGHMAAANVRAESGATTFREWGQSLAEALEGNGEKMRGFMRITGLSEKQLRSMTAKDIWVEFLKGMDKAGAGGKEMADAIGLGGDRAIAVFNQLSGTVAEGEKAFKLAKEEVLNGGKAIEEEYRPAIETLSKKVVILGNVLSDLGIQMVDANEGWMSDALDWATNMARKLKDVNDAVAAFAVAVAHYTSWVPGSKSGEDIAQAFLASEGMTEGDGGADSVRRGNAASVPGSGSSASAKTGVNTGSGGGGGRRRGSGNGTLVDLPAKNRSEFGMPLGDEHTGGRDSSFFGRA